MINIILGIFLVGTWIAVFSAGRRIDKLKQKVDDNKELIRDLYRIDDERLLENLPIDVKEASKAMASVLDKLNKK